MTIFTLIDRKLLVKVKDKWVALDVTESVEYETQKQNSLSMCYLWMES